MVVGMGLRWRITRRPQSVSEIGPLYLPPPPQKTSRSPVEKKNAKSVNQQTGKPRNSEKQKAVVGFVCSLLSQSLDGTSLYNPERTECLCSSNNSNSVRSTMFGL